MNLRFGDAHLDTLTKLKTLAEKHGMYIRFGINNSCETDRDLNWILDYVDETANAAVDTLDDYYDEIIDGEIRKDSSTLWFELYDPKGNGGHGKHHSMSYNPESIGFMLKDDWEETLNNVILEINEGDSEDEKEIAIKNIQKLIVFLTENCGDGWQGVEFKKAPTCIRGFGYPKEFEDGRVYREGMALHFFTELVCQYLNEPMIDNVY